MWSFKPDIVDTIIFIIIIGGGTLPDTIDHKVATVAMGECWADMVDSVTCYTDFAKHLKTKGLIPNPVFTTAIDRSTNRSTQERVSDLLSSVETAIKQGQGECFAKLCDILKVCGGTAVADKLCVTYQEMCKKQPTQ